MLTSYDGSIIFIRFMEIGEGVFASRSLTDAGKTDGRSVFERDVAFVAEEEILTIVLPAYTGETRSFFRFVFEVVADGVSSSGGSLDRLAFRL